VKRVRRGPRPLESALDRLRGELAPESLLGDVQGAWLEAVGRSIADQARPVSERDGVITVSCSASVWAQELDLMSPAIIKRLNRTLGNDRIARLRCVSTPPRDP
jgi:predicted nucleic acid-binding Zn ribbon protein